MALMDLIGKQAGLPVYALGGKFRTECLFILMKWANRRFKFDEWRRLASETVASGYTKFKFDIDYIAPDLVSDVWSRSMAANK